ncbi:aldehyde dehydrogenase family protein [Glaciihabitans sp. INWT7]|uniref:bifunctional proline dehydrogenase/L-glutamate gamma-semialdehyde dehydrogenase n=1 Tax=Glaciihabitans sp. INWT7 TaxID=2596912 RepID=UPI0016296C35|nr:bifunctional proline dehydrogenase/L-glutamate gamma-semialdehyde dehydrogenase [Glaciihabitans sp. INWT7]QNE45566.1 aldehyde dehydrogenase family protein [Glaciihabitans sp. INWT7]
MLSPAADSPVSPDPLAAEAVATVRRWLAESADVAPDRSAERLASVLKDPRGLDFTIGFVDRVVRAEDLRVAGRNLEKLSRAIPAFLPWYMRIAIQLGGGFAPLIPWPIVPIARRVLRGMVSHLILDASPRQLDRSMRQLRRSGIRLNLNLLGEAVLGDEEADRRLAGTIDLLGRDDVDYVSIKVSSVSSQLSMWSFNETVERVVKRLTPLYELAAASPTTKFINLDMEEFRDLDLTIAVFRRILEQPKLTTLEAGIVLQAYLPDALEAMQGLTAWAIERRAAGGAGIKVRVVKGANLAMEHVDAAVHGWPLATWGAKRDTDANYKRVLDWSFLPARTDAVRIGVAGHNLFDIAWAWLLAKQRKVETRVEFEMLLGMATGQADAVRRDVGGLLLYTPVVHPGEFDSAISYLIRRLEENASSENFMSGVFELAGDPAIFDREADRFVASLEQLAEEQQSGFVPASHRVQDRRLPVPIAPVDTAPRVFANEADTDPSIAANRAWGREILSRIASSTLGEATVAAARITGLPALEGVVTATARAGESWGQRRSDTRATVLHSAGEALAAARAELIEVMASETGKTISEGDVEVSEAVDFAHYYAERARELDRVADAEFEPSRLIVVTPPWNFPVAIPAGSVLAALASGAGVIIKPAPQARRSAAVMVEALWAGGVPRDVLALVDLDEADLGRELVSHPSVDRVILTGAWETARLFRSWRPDLPLLAETSGKNAIIVTPSADLDLAVADVVKSAFGHAGQKCSAASLVILVGSVATSQRFRRQLLDSVSTLRVGYPQEATTVMGPIVEPAHGKLRAALTTLGAGESWLLAPRSLDESGTLWSPGVKDGVTAGSEFHLTEYFGPVLGIMRADTLEQAIALQNAPAYGLTAGIHSLDAAEIALWIDSVQAGNLYVNRGITGAVVRRQPFGGWKRSTVGASAKAGGPNYLLTLGEWRPMFAEPGRTAILKGLSEAVSRVIEAAQQGMEFLEFDRVRAGATSDQQAWVEEYGTVKDVSGLGVERNVFRYRAVPVTVRLAEGASPAQLVRTIVAATRAGASLSISSAVPVAAALVRLFGSAVPPLTVESVVVESDARWHSRLQGEARPSRIRLLGGDRLTLATVLDGDPDVAIYAGPVTTSGRIELLPFLHEQAISMTAHRFGNPDPSTFVAL